MREIKFKFYNTKDKFVSTTPLYLKEINLAEYDDDEWIPLQYTGLKDKNGKEIYEGDICNVVYPRESIPGSIEFKNGKFMWTDGIGHWNIIPDYTAKLGETEAVFEGYYFEVIGNVFENNDLLCTD